MCLRAEGNYLQSLSSCLSLFICPAGLVASFGPLRERLRERQIHWIQQG